MNDNNTGFNDLANQISRFQAILAAAGNAPEIEAALLRRLVCLMLPDASDQARAKFDAEIVSYLELSGGES